MALDVSISPDLALVFTTPPYVRRIPDSDALNAELARLILAWRASEGGMAISNSGGWQSPATLFERPQPEIGQLRARVDERCAR